MKLYDVLKNCKPCVMDTSDIVYWREVGISVVVLQESKSDKSDEVKYPYESREK